MIVYYMYNIGIVLNNVFLTIFLRLKRALYLDLAFWRQKRWGQLGMVSLE